MDLNHIVLLQVCLGVIIAALNLRAALYLRGLWEDSHTTSHPERSWLLRALVILVATLLVACVWFLVSLAINVVMGTQIWLRVVNAVVIIAILTVPVRLVAEFKRRERNARDLARVPELED